MVKNVNAIQTIDNSDLVLKLNYNTKIVEIEKEIPDNGITTPELLCYSTNNTKYVKASKNQIIM